MACEPLLAVPAESWREELAHGINWTNSLAQEAQSRVGVVRRAAISLVYVNVLILQIIKH